MLLGNPLEWSGSYPKSVVVCDETRTLSQACGLPAEASKIAKLDQNALHVSGLGTQEHACSYQRCSQAKVGLAHACTSFWTCNASMPAQHSMSAHQTWQRHNMLLELHLLHALPIDQVGASIEQMLLQCPGLPQVHWRGSVQMAGQASKAVQLQNLPIWRRNRYEAICGHAQNLHVILKHQQQLLQWYMKHI